MGPVKEALNEDMARWMGLPTDKVSLAQITPETWLGWARMKGLSAPVIAKMNKAISDAGSKQGRDLTPQEPQTPMAKMQALKASEGEPMPFVKQPVDPLRGTTNVEETPAALPRNQNNLKLRCDQHRKLYQRFLQWARRQASLLPLARKFRELASRNLLRMRDS